MYNSVTPARFPEERFLVPDERGSGKPQLPKPQIADMGRWPANLQALKERLRQNGVPPDEIDSFIDKIRKRREEFQRTVAMRREEED